MLPRNRVLRHCSDPSLESHEEFVVELAMDKARPTSERQGTKSKFRFDPAIKFVKDNVNHNPVGIQAIDSWRIDEIGAKFTGRLIPLAPQLIGCKPPEIPEEVRPGKSGNPVPKNEAR